MNYSDFDDLVPQKGTAATRIKEVPTAVSSGTISPEEVKGRLSSGLYETLSDGSNENTIRAIERASIHVKAIINRLGKTFTIDEPVIRETVLLYTIYELHMALGHEEAGRECRIKARDLIIAAYGDYPETEKSTNGAALGAITVPARKLFP